MPPPPDDTHAVTEADLLRICDVARSTRQNWVRHRLVTHQTDGRYVQRDVMETVITRLLTRCLGGLDDVSRVWTSERDAILVAAADSEAQQVTLLVEPRLLSVVVTTSVGDLGAALRPLEPAVAVPLTAELQVARDAFWRFAVATPTVERDGPQRSVRPATAGSTSLITGRR